MNTKEKAYRASFTTADGGVATMDFYATSLSLAKDHAALMAQHHGLTLGRVTSHVESWVESAGEFVNRKRA